MIVSTLLSFFTQVTKIDHRMEIASSEVQKRQNLQVRCQQIFATLLPSQLCPENSPPFFTPEKKDSSDLPVLLSVIYDQGVDPDPMFSGPVRAQFYIDEENNFICEVTPLEKNLQKHKRKEALWKEVKKLTFEYFAVGVNEDKNTNNFKWLKSWDKSNDKIPPMIKISIEDEKNYVKEFAFFPSSSHAEIIFQDKRL